MLKRRLHLFAVMFFFLSSLSAFADGDEKRLFLPVGSSPVIGPEKAPVTIIEFVDFQ